MAIPFGVFWVMLFFSRRELGLRGIGICTALGLGLLAVLLFVPALWMVAVIGQVLLDIVLILILFGGDIRIN
jgi:hypothetical protein